MDGEQQTDDQPQLQPSPLRELEGLNVDEQQQEAVEQPQLLPDALLESPKKLTAEDMLACVSALEAALLPCLSANEMELINKLARNACLTELPSIQRHQEVNVEKHASDFMESAKKLQQYFAGLQGEEPSTKVGLQGAKLPTKAEKLKQEIAAMEEELKIKTGLIMKHEKLIQGWRKELKDQADKHNSELERV